MTPIEKKLLLTKSHIKTLLSLNKLIIDKDVKIQHEYSLRKIEQWIGEITLYLNKEKKI